MNVWILNEIQTTAKTDQNRNMWNRNLMMKMMLKN